MTHLLNPPLTQFCSQYLLLCCPTSELKDASAASVTRQPQVTPPNHFCELAQLKAGLPSSVDGLHLPRVAPESQRTVRQR